MKKKNRTAIPLFVFFLIIHTFLSRTDCDTKKLSPPRITMSKSDPDKSGPFNSSLGEVFDQLGISISKADDFVIQKNISMYEWENTFFTVSAEKNGSVIKIEVINNIDNNSAERRIEEKKYIINSLYYQTPSPYPGMISNTIEYPDEFKPKVEYIEIEGVKTAFLILSSTSRFTYGVGAEELIAYRGALIFIYNEKEKKLYQIELFIPKEKFDKKDVLSIFGSIVRRSKVETVQEKSSDIKKDRNANKNYNLIIIGFEPLGVNHTGASGYFRDTTPNLDKFSKNAFLFKNAVSPSSWTLPSFMSWFTSLYPSQHKILNKYSIYTDKEKVFSNLSELSPSAVTLAQVLKKNGYSTAGFTGDAGVAGNFGYNLGFDIYYDKITFAGFDLVLPMALEWINKNRDENFFLFIQGYDVHGRYQLPADFKNQFADPNYKGKYKGTVDEYWKLRDLSVNEGFLNMADEDIKFWESWYDAKIYEADKKLGTFFDEFDKMGLGNKTIIVVSSGSGNEFYEHKRFDHGFSLYEELIRVPLIIKVPDKKGSVIENQVRTLDIMPTVLDMLDIKYNEIIKDQMQGVTLVPLMNGEDLKLDAFSETDYLSYTFKRSLRTSDGWKYIHSIDTRERELYNLRDDPKELNNLAEKEKRIAYELEQKLFKHLKSIGEDYKK
ncbi:MAG: sulfatase [bacterium]|nr:sulfatase [bacterium]